MEEFKKKLELVVEKTFTILRENRSESRIVFPCYRDSQRRVSEQELRFVFVEQVQDLLKEYNYFYSVETPTKSKYVFSEKKKYVSPRVDDSGRSASFDLSIVDKDGNTIAIIEFKAKSAHPHEYAKDICKLWNPKEKAKYKYFINLFEKIEEKTKNSFLNKLVPKDPNGANPKDSNEYLLPKTSSEQIIVIAQSLVSDDKIIKEII